MTRNSGLSVSNVAMEQTKPSAAPLFKKGLSWFVVVLGLLLGIAGVALVESTLVFSPYFRPEWSQLAGFSLLGVVALLASLIAVENPRRAALVFFVATPIMASCVAWSQRMSIVVMGVSVHRILAVFAGTSLLFLIPGAFWLGTANARWPVVSSGWKRSTKICVRALLAAALSLTCVAAGLFVTLEMPSYGRWDCNREIPPVYAQRFPGNAVFTADVVLVGNSDGPLSNYSYWAIARVHRRFWGLSSWAPQFVILRGIFKQGERREYFVDGRPSDALLAHFLFVIEPYPCCHTQPLERAGADLRALQEGPPKSGTRIIGSVFTRMYGKSQPARDIEILVTGPEGRVTTITDQEGVYDVGPLPPGHYSVQVASADARLRMYHAEGDVKSGQVWGATLVAPGAARSTP